MKQPVRVEYDGELRVVKYHHEIEDGFYQGEYSKLPIKGRTTAYITIQPGEYISADAYCSAKDQYSKKIGRIVSTVRLLKNLGVQDLRC